MEDDVCVARFAFRQRLAAVRDIARPAGGSMHPTEGGREDALLLAAIADGSEDALRAFYDRYSGLVFTVALRLMNDREAASEVVQDVFLRCWERAATFEPSRGKPRGWPLTMARKPRHRCAAHPPRARRTSADIDDELQMQGIPEASEADHGDAVAVRLSVNDAMTTLPPVQRQALELALLGQFTQREIAETLDVPLGTVKTRIRDGMARLRIELLAGEGMRRDCNEHPIDDLAAYALDVLEADEHAAVARHIAQCTLCSAEVRDYTLVAATARGGMALEPAPAGGWNRSRRKGRCPDRQPLPTGRAAQPSRA